MIHGVDPGNTTGVATYDLSSHIFTSWQVVWSDKSQPMFISRGDLVACERFFVGKRTVRAKRGWQGATRALGGVREAAESVGARFELQSASDAKSLTSNELLKALGWYKTKMPHANDAARHVLLAIARHYPHEFDTLMRRTTDV